MGNNALESYARFQDLLEKKNITAYNVAKNTGVTTATLTSWKQGKYVPKNDKLEAIANYLGVTVSYILNGSDEESSFPAFEPEHVEIIELYSKLNKEQKTAILSLLRAFAPATA